jgi:DNA-binding beta-propeller fold protein YncE
MDRVWVQDPYGRLVSTVEGLNIPLGIAIDKDHRIYVGEQGKGRVTVFDQNWNTLYALGIGDGEFLLPNDIAIDSDTGEIYVSDSESHTVKVYSPKTGAFVRSFGGKGSGPGQFDFPTGVYVTPLGVGPGIEVYVADQNNDRIQVFDQNGNFLRCIGKSGSFSFSNKFGRIQGLTGDSQGRLYVADAFQGYVQVLDSFGLQVATIGSFGAGAGQLRTPMDVAIDPYNRLVVTAANSARIELYGIDVFTDPHIIAAVVDVKPDTVNLSRGKGLISTFIELPGYPLQQIDVTTITANGVPGDPASASIADYDGDGVSDLKIDFDQDLVFAGMADGDAPVLVSGDLITMEIFEGVDTVQLNTGKGGGKK